MTLRCRVTTQKWLFSFKTKLLPNLAFFSEGLSLAPVGTSRSIKDEKVMFLEFSLLRVKIEQYFCTIITNLILITREKNFKAIGAQESIQSRRE